MSSLPVEGELFDAKYVIGPVLGIGGMAAVLAARNVGLDQMVAIKILLPECCDDAAVVERFVQEGKTASKIRSEHVVRTLDVGVADGRAYIVMEYLRGRDLAALLREDGPLPVGTAVDLLLQASEAVGEGHALGIIHRDLKPANLFLTHQADGSPCVKVLDFGISRMPRGSAELRGGSQPTLPSVVMGSPQYMSPEQMMSSAKADRRSDVWSLGAILYELLTGQMAFGGATTTEVCARVLQGAPAPVLELTPDVPAEVCRAIARCLEKDGSRRFDNVAEFARALAPFGSRSARASAESISRVTEGVIAEGEPPMRVAPANEAATMKPTAAEILAIRPPRRRKRSGYLIASLLLAAAGLGAGAFALREDLSRALAPVVAVAGAPAPPLAPSVPPAVAPEPPVDVSPPASTSNRAPLRSTEKPIHHEHPADSPHPRWRPLGPAIPDAGAGADEDDPYDPPPAPTPGVLR